MTGFIYLITNQINGKQYIGQTTTSLRCRWNGHCSDARQGDKTIICAAIRKYGRDNFIMEQIATASSLDRLNELEVHFISLHGTLKPAGYNLDEGGNNRLTHPESRQKLSRAMKGNTNGRFTKGRVVSTETRLKLSVVRKGRPSNRRGATQTPEARAKMSASHLGKDLSRNKGRKHSTEARRNMSLAHLGQKPSPETLVKRSASLRRHHMLRRAKLNGETVSADPQP